MANNQRAFAGDHVQSRDVCISFHNEDARRQDNGKNRAKKAGLKSFELHNNTLLGIKIDVKQQLSTGKYILNFDVIDRKLRSVVNKFLTHT